MSTYSTYNTMIESKIANTSEIFYDEEMKRQEMNNTIDQMLQDYDIPEFIRKPAGGTLAFVGGKADHPADFFRVVKFWNDDNNEYTYLPPTDFDQLSATSSYYWTTDYDESDSTRKFFIKPEAVTSLNMRYIKKFTELIAPTTESGLSSSWDEVVAYGTASRLFQNSNRYDESREYERLYRQRLAEVFLALKNEGGIKENARLRSKYERTSLL